MTQTTTARRTFFAGLFAASLLTSCGGTQTPVPVQTPAGTMVVDNQQALKAAPAPSTSAPSTPAPAPKAATPLPPRLRVVTSPQTLTKEGSVFFLVSSADQSGQGLSVTEVFVDGVRFVNDPKQYNSYAKYFSAKHNGTHTVRVVVTDKSGLSTAVEQDFSVAIGQ